jgi:hypothetical protein
MSKSILDWKQEVGGSNPLALTKEEIFRAEAVNVAFVLLMNHIYFLTRSSNFCNELNNLNSSPYQKCLTTHIYIYIATL